jgi:hypothetical protein
MSIFYLYLHIATCAYICRYYVYVYNLDAVVALVRKINGLYPNRFIRWVIKIRFIYEHLYVHLVIYTYILIYLYV